MRISLEHDLPASRGDDDWIEAPHLTAEKLCGSMWHLSELAAHSLSPFLVLAPGGLIGNFFHPQIDAWQVVHGRLLLIDKKGLPTLIFNVCQLQGQDIVSMAGRATINGIDAIYVLTSTDHPPHPVLATPSHVERRATFLKQPSAEHRRPNLVVVRANAASLHPRWLEDVTAKTRSWDLCISWYGNETPDLSVSPEYLTHAPNQKKFKPLFDLFYPDSPLWNYDRIWLPDDDLLVSGQDLNLMFHLSRKFGLDLAQPALRDVPGCHINHPITAQKPGSDVRMEPFVEIMCPLFSKRALEICIGSIKDAVSGYGLDHLWPSFLGRPATRMGIIDAVGIVHTRPIGASYDVRGAIGEQAAIWNSYGFTYAPIPGVR